MSAPLVLVPQYFGSLVFDRRLLRYLSFDHESTRLLVDLQRDGIGPVVARIGDEDERAAVLRFIDSLDTQRFFRLDGRLDAEVRGGRTAPPDHLVGPLVVHLEIVGACNLTCTHCFAGELPRNQHPLQVGEMEVLFADLNRLGTFRVSLTGGEPLLRKDLLDILDGAVAAGLHPSLTTNALLLTEEMARELGKRPRVGLNASLEGPTAEINDPVRGRGTFDAVVDKLRLLARHAAFTLGFTLMRTNAHLARECLELARSVGARAVVFRPLYPAGVALHHLDLMPSFEQYIEALEALTCVANSPPVVSAAPTCGAGRHLCSISVQGDVNPCGFLGPGFITGNIREQPFEVIWRTGQQMRRMRQPSGADGFRGGCRARALVLAGSVEAPDPWMTEAEESAASVASLRSTTAHRGQGAGLHPCANLEVSASSNTGSLEATFVSGKAAGAMSLPLLAGG